MEYPDDRVLNDDQLAHLIGTSDAVLLIHYITTDKGEARLLFDKVVHKSKVILKAPRVNLGTSFALGFALGFSKANNSPYDEYYVNIGDTGSKPVPTA
jgi:hypothetical protein